MTREKEAHNDAFGQALLDYWQGQEDVQDIIERDDGYIGASSGIRLYFAGYAAWQSTIQEALTHVYGRVLDIGCGAGRHALYLQDQGHAVVGIDVSPGAIEVCRARGLRQAEVRSVTQVSRASTGTFDTLIMLGNNFGLMANPRRARWLLRRFKAMTPPNGRIIAESCNPYDTDDPLHLQYHARNRARGRLAGQLRLRTRYRHHVGAWFDYLFVSPEEMQQIVDGTGWHVARFIHAPDNPNYVAIIEKRP